MYRIYLFLIFGFLRLVLSKVVHLNWNITWVNAAPDGFQRPVIGVNGKWPTPQIDVELGDRLIVDVYNGLGNQSTGIHWHGLHQYMTGVMDGAPGTTQCPVEPGHRIRYDVMVKQSGTFWYHSHNMGQYPDGLRGPLIAHDPACPFDYDDEFTITLSDWYHDQMPVLLERWQSQSNEPGYEPVPDSALINDSVNSTFKVEPNKTYLIHIVAIGNWPGHAIIFDDHEFTIVEYDGIYTEPYPSGSQDIRMAPGQRTSILLRTKSDASRNYAIWDLMDLNAMFIDENRPIPPNYNGICTAWLVYDESLPFSASPPAPPTDFVDDATLVPADQQPLLEPVDHQITMVMDSTKINGFTRFVINNQTYIRQKVPSLYTALTVGPEYYANPAVYGLVNPFVINYGEVVEIVINNHHSNLHPWHLHGHEFQVVQRSPPNVGDFSGNLVNVSSTPVRRDTIMVQNHGYAVLRFRATNPGVWLLHCHIEWHVEAGLIATIIEAPDRFQKMKRPDDFLNVCASYPLPSYGNAAGNAGLDMTGANTAVPNGDPGAVYPPPPSRR